MIYLDTSVLVAYYSPEALSGQAEEVITAHVRPAISRLVEVEFFSALARKVREGGIDRKDAERLSACFLKHLEHGFYTLFIPDLLHYQLARGWISQFDLTLRTLDALHLAIAASENLCLVTADQDLAKSGDRLGIEIMLLTP